MKIYLAGPMTGYPNFNFPAFHEAADALREQGYTVVSPAELDSPAAKKAAEESIDGDPSHYAKGETWGDLLARDVKLISDGEIEAIVCLPGWATSRGARLEAFVGRLNKLPILSYPTLEPVDADVIGLAHGIRLTFPSETRVVDPVTGGAKGSKPERYDLLPFDQLDEVARLYSFGTEKYEANNWRRGYDWHLSYSSLIRHARAFWGGESIDDETKCHHLASVVFHALALMYFEKAHPDGDDRWVA
jgi:hypothetical protein